MGQLKRLRFACLFLLAIPVARAGDLQLSVTIANEWDRAETLNVVEIQNEQGKQYRIEYGATGARNVAKKIITRDQYAHAIGSLSRELGELKLAVQDPERCPETRIVFKERKGGFQGGLCRDAGRDYRHEAMVVGIVKRFTGYLEGGN